jgi:hypothetical protein
MENEQVLSQKGTAPNTEFLDLHVPIGAKRLHYEGPDIFAKLKLGLDKSVKIESAPVLSRGADGNFYDNKRHKMGMRDGWPTAIVSRNYTFVANEIVHDMVTKSGFKPTNVHFSKSGDAMFIEIFPDESNSTASRFSWSNDGKNGDNVKVGVMVRNSIDATAALGGDIFTYRARCSNGAIVGRKDMGSFSIRHVGAFDGLMAKFKQHMRTAFEMSLKVKEVYMQAERTKYSDRLAEAMVATAVPKKFLPSFIRVLPNGQVVVDDKNRTAWDAFNEVTENVWHSDKLSMPSKMSYTQRANSWLIQAVEVAA